LGPGRKFGGGVEVGDMLSIESLSSYTRRQAKNPTMQLMLGVLIYTSLGKWCPYEGSRAVEVTFEKPRFIVLFIVLSPNFRGFLGGFFVSENNYSFFNHSITYDNFRSLELNNLNHIEFHHTLSKVYIWPLTG